MKVSVIVANYNGKQYLKNCFNSLFNQNFNGKLEIIFVDDNSIDGSYDFVKNCFPQIIAIKNSQNLGHAASCNKAVNKATGDYLFLIDNDTEFDKNCIKNMLETFSEDNKIGCVGGMIKDYGDSNIIQDMGMNIDIFGYGYSKVGSISGFINKDTGQFKKISQCFYISSCALMIKKELFNRIGSFDDKYFMYKDDLDLCWRIQLAGYKIVINPKAKIYHKMGVTLGGTSIKEKEKYQTSVKKRYFGERNTIRTLIKNYQLYNILLILPIYLLINLMEIIFFVVTLNIKVAQSYLLAWWWNIINLQDTLSERQKVQKNRIIRDRQIMDNIDFTSYKLKTLLNMGLPKFK